MSAEKLLAKLKNEHQAHEKDRAEVVAASDDARRASKRAIFAVQRGDGKAAEGLLEEARRSFDKVRAKAETDPRLAHEGSFRSALEEYAEAVFYRGLLSDGELKPIEELDSETQIGGLCDAVGEIVRSMIAAATAGGYKEVARLKDVAAGVLDGLNEMDYGGYLRTKYDQACGHLRKAEDIMYEVSLRRKT